MHPHHRRPLRCTVMKNKKKSVIECLPTVQQQKFSTIKITFHSAKPFKCGGPIGVKKMAVNAKLFAKHKSELPDFLSGKCLRVASLFKDRLFLLFLYCLSLNLKRKKERLEQLRDEK